MRIADCTAGSYLECAVQTEAHGLCLAAEHALEVIVNEQPVMRLVCTPSGLDELVIGRLLTEGLIGSAEDIRELYICPEGHTCRVWLREGLKLEPSAERAAEIGTCCTDNRTLALRRAEELKRVEPLRWEAEWLKQLAARLGEGEALYRQTHAVHACYLGREGELLCVREDIGRHNALDKAVGYAALHGVRTESCYLFTTGRMPADMVVKAVRAGIPLLASKTYPTDQGLTIARRAGLTLATVERSGRVTVWTDGEGEK